VDKPTLTGEMLVLRPIGPQDADAMWEVASDPESRRLAGMSAEPTREDVARWTAGVAAADGRIDLAVTTTGSDEYLGEIVLDAIDRHVGSANLRLTMRPAYRGRGYGTEAIELVLGMAFDGLGLHRVGLVLPAINTRAKSLYENLGFRVEGRLRDAFRDGDGWTDGLVMGLLEDEYRAGQHA
jgi:RimJ/RimL family protein N-acetyltransferase